MESITPLLLAMLFIGLVPMIAILVTAFTKVSIILLILRNALGIQQTPPNIVIYAISLLMSIIIMEPVIGTSFSKIDIDNLQKMTKTELISTAEGMFVPFKDFMQKNSSVDSRNHFVDLMKRKDDKNPKSESNYSVIIPAFLLDELTKAIYAGILIYLPFLIIDFIVGAILVALGMQNMSATAVATPLKFLLFFQISGWEKLFDMLILSYT